MARMPYSPAGRTRPRTRIAGLALAGALVAGGVAGAVPAGAAPQARSATTAAALGYPYPNAPDCNESTGANCVKDAWGFIQGQCHSWVAYRLNELNAAELGGLTFNDHYRLSGTKEWNNPSNWLTAAAAAGVTVDTTPALGAVAWWSEDGAHVAYVEAVRPDGSLRISEMNTDWHNSFDFAVLRVGGRWPDKFIHIADRPVGSNVPEVPRSVRAVATGVHAVKVRWKAPVKNSTTITGYTVTASPGGVSATVAPSVVVATIKNLTAGTSYTFSVLATSANGDGPASAPSNAVVPSRGSLVRF